MFVWRFSQTDLRGFSGNGFFVGNNRIRFNDFNVGEFGDQIVQANFDM